MGGEDTGNMNEADIFLIFCLEDRAAVMDYLDFCLIEFPLLQGWSYSF